MNNYTKPANKSILEVLFVISFLAGLIGLVAGYDYASIFFFIGLVGLMFSGENNHN